MCTRANTAGPASPARYRATACDAAPIPEASPRCIPFPGARLTCPRSISMVKAIGASYQTPGAIDKMRNSACTRMVGFNFIDGAGHWVQQEQPEQVNALLIQFLRDYAKT